MLTPREEIKMSIWSFVVHIIKAMEFKCLLGFWRIKTFESELSHFNKSFRNILQSMYVEQWECAYYRKYSPCFLGDIIFKQIIKQDYVIQNKNTRT
jgi:hypothetical protein